MDRDLEVTILGSGTCVPSLTRKSCSVMVKASGDILLLDVGPGTMHQLLLAGVAVHDVTALMVSHFHPDHSGELASFLFANKYPDQSLRTRPITLLGGPGFLEFWDKLCHLYGDWMELGQEWLSVQELHPGQILNLKNLSLTAGSVNHRPESIAAVIQSSSGKKIVYTGDTDVSEDLTYTCSGADLLICESATPDHMKVPGHLTPSLAGDIASAAGVSHLVLTHFYPSCSSEAAATGAKKQFKGPVTIARDLMTLQFHENGFLEVS